MTDARFTSGAERRLLLALSLISGLGGVVYEVLYLRQLTTLLGDMFYVHAGLLGMFLFGNGLGAWLAHRFRPWLYVFEFIIGGYALLLPLLIPFYEASFLANLFASPVAQTMFMSAILLAVPSVCIGFSIPLFSDYVRAATPAGDGDGRDVAFKLTYTLYNVGAAASVIFVEFALIRWVGYTQALMLVGSANISCGVVLLARRARLQPEALSHLDREPRVPNRDALALLLASVAAAVFTGFYIKVCYNLFLPHRENFAICTSIAVLSIALGTQLVRRFRVSFEMLLLIALIALGLCYANFGSAFALYEALEGRLPDLVRKGAVGFVLGLPYLFMGATIPALLPDEDRVARRAGLLLFYSGIGNVVGLLAYTFVLHPQLQFFTSAIVSGLLLVAALIARGRLERRQGVPLTAALLLLYPIYIQPESLVYLMRRDLTPAARVTHYKSSSDNVSYVEDGFETKISYNGHASIQVTVKGAVNTNEILVGLLPALVAPRHESALVMGLGSGVTAGTTATAFAHTDIVEINAAFFPLVERLAAANFAVGDNPRATIVHEDARRFLQDPPRVYDAIVSTVPSPTYFAAGKIYTSEFYARVKAALAPDGIFSGWFTPVDMSIEGLATIQATLARSFAHCSLAALGDAYFAVACSDAPIERRHSFAIPDSVRAALAGRRLRGISVDQWLSAMFIADDIFANQDLEGVPLNTDDFPILEFQIMRQGTRAVLTKDDPIVSRPNRYNVKIVSSSERGEFLDRALLFSQVYPGFFKRFYRPRLRSDAVLEAEYNRRLARPPGG